MYIKYTINFWVSKITKPIKRLAIKVWKPIKKAINKMCIFMRHLHKNTKKILIGVEVILVAALCVVIVLMTTTKEEISNTIVQNDTGQSSGIESQEPRGTLSQNIETAEAVDGSKYEEIYAQNNDMIGWITIDNTVIDYPVVQADNNERYMNVSFEGDESKAGTIFLDSKCNISDLSNLSSQTNLILYGHHMKNGSMFENLMMYKDEEFFMENNKIAFNTLNTDYQWEIFSVYVSPVTFNYIDTTFPTSANWIKFLNTCKSKSLYENDVIPDENDIILTLSTCTYEYDNARFVVQARLIKDAA